MCNESGPILLDNLTKAIRRDLEDCPDHWEPTLKGYLCAAVKLEANIEKLTEAIQGTIDSCPHPEGNLCATCKMLQDALDDKN